MKHRAVCALLVAAIFLSACNSKPAEQSSPAPAASAKQQTVEIGGAPAVVLTRPRNNDQSKPQFLAVTVLPGRAMNVWQVRAFVPGKGEVDLMTAPPLPEAKTLLDNNDDEFGNKAFSAGGAILLPYANRIRGKLSADKKTITTDIAGHQLALPASWKGKQPTAVINSMHGLILHSKFENIEQKNDADSSSVSGILHAGNFNGQWLSETDVQATTTLKDGAVELVVVAKNVGKDPLPMAIGWHPYFNVLSGQREQAKLHLPATMRAIVNNYDDVFPTGKLEPVKGTPYDFNVPGGRELGKLYMDDNFTNVQHQADGSVVSEIIDPAAKYGLRITALTPEVRAIQIYAPPDKSFIVLEPQTNLADPYNKKIWGNTDTGMVTLQPGQSLTYRVRLEIFDPTASPAAHSH